MERIVFLLITCLFNFNISAQRTELLVYKETYVVSYNELYEQPNWVVYVVQDKPNTVSRKGMNFFKEAGIKTSDNGDYYKNIWDKGHLAPAADFSDTENNLKSTFSYLNCSLQHEKLNRGQWKILESQVRHWVDSIGPIKVIDELEFQKEHIILDTGGHVPNGFTKHVVFPDNNLKCFYFKNENSDSWKNAQIDCRIDHQKKLNFLLKNSSSK